MTDNTRNLGKQDDIRVNTNQPHEVTYWTYKWNITEEQLREAVRAAGPMVTDIERYLQQKQGRHE